MHTLLKRHFGLLLFLILVFAAATRLYRLDQPKVYIFDEVYHAVTAKLIHRNDPRAYEWWNPPIEPNTAVDWLHPPLAKYTQALSMSIFGENSFGWRFSSAVFGVLVVWMTALLALELFQSKPLALAAGLFASLDGLLLVQSRIAMNDIHVTFFILLSLWVYLKYRKIGGSWWLFLTGVCAGLALSSKWSGFFVVVVINLFELIHMGELRKKLRLPRLILSRLLMLIVVPITVYILSYSHMFMQGKSLICQGDQVKQGQCYCSQTSSWWVEGLSHLLPSQRPYFESLEARGGCKRLISHFSELHHQIW